MFQHSYLLSELFIFEAKDLVSRYRVQVHLLINFIEESVLYCISIETINDQQVFRNIFVFIITNKEIVQSVFSSLLSSFCPVLFHFLSFNGVSKLRHRNRFFFINLPLYIFVNLSNFPHSIYHIESFQTGSKVMK